MTSANVVHYELVGNDMRLIETESQHALCKDSISEVLERWEREYPNALLQKRWPDENEVDEYLIFEESDGYEEEDFIVGRYLDNERDTIRLSAFMKRRRIKEIARHESTIEWFREKLREHTGDQRTEDYKQRREFHAFIEERRDYAEKSSSEKVDIRAKTWIEDGEFRCEYQIHGLDKGAMLMLAGVLEEFSE